MNGTAIKDVKNCFLGNVGTAAKTQNTSSAESFSSIFNKSQKSQSQDNGADIDVSQKKTEKTSYCEAVGGNKKAEQLSTKEEKNVDFSKQEAMETAAKEAGVEMMEKTAEVFGVSIEELEAAMEVLGMTALDLLNPENLTQVVLALNPEMDALSIMTDEQLFLNLKELMNTAEGLTEQLQEKFQVSAEELTASLSEMKSPKEEVQMPVSGMDQTIEEVVEVVSVPKTEENENSMLGLPKEKMEGQAVNTDSSLEASAALKTEGSEEQRSSFYQEDGSNMARQSFSQSFLNQLAESVEKAQASQAPFSASGQEIISQITDYIKLHIKPQTTEMELQLHPASLGNVKVQIASTEGILTATFTTQNEAVKAALEAQLIQLKENFAQQGLKVESIEVNVATQGFERSLDQQNQGNQQYEEPNKRSGRRIRLEGLESLDKLESLEDLPEEDKVVADMMIRNGNTVDYTV